MCSLQLCCAIWVEEKDSPVLLARKAEYHRTKLLHRRTDTDLREKGNRGKTVIFSSFMQILIAISAFL